jgi:hypothetical protein
MSDASTNLSIESPMEETTAWDDTPALPIPACQAHLPAPPHQEISGATLQAIALAPLVSPRSALALLDAYQDIDQSALRAITWGLMVTIQQRDAYHAQQQRHHEQTIKELQEKVGEYKMIFDSVPNGYKENNGHLPNFNIPVGNGMY